METETITPPTTSIAYQYGQLTGLLKCINLYIMCAPEFREIDYFERLKVSQAMGKFVERELQQIIK